MYLWLCGVKVPVTGEKNNPLHEKNKKIDASELTIINFCIKNIMSVWKTFFDMHF